MRIPISAWSDYITGNSNVANGEIFELLAQYQELC